jgi:carboxyl-terminal processing protease
VSQPAMADSRPREVRRWRGVVVALIALALAGCGDQKPRPVAAKSKTPPSTTAEFVESTSTTIAPKTPGDYLRQGLDIIQENAFYSSKLDWAAERAKAQQLAADATSFADTYPVISEVLRDLGDRHSRFATPDQVNEAAGGLLPEGPPNGRVLTPTISLLHLPVVSGPQTSPGAHRYVEAAEGILRGSPLACGWVLDLRGNPGGNLVPIMLAAAPLLGEGDAVIVRDNEGKPHPFGYRDKKISYEGKVIGGIEGTMAPIAPPPAVAVLTDQDTASSAEFLLLAFHVRPNTRTFGAETVGLTGGNGVFKMADGAQIVLTTTLAEDLRGRRYDGPVVPDEAVDPATAETAAVRWLESTPGCRR